MSLSTVLPGPISSMVFNNAGDELWICHPSTGIEVLSWPNAELLRVVPVIAFALCAHPNDPYLAALSYQSISLLDPVGRVLRSWSISGALPLAAAFLEDGLRLLYLERQVAVLWSCSWVDPKVQRLAEIPLGAGRVRWATLLPQRQMAFFTLSDGPALLWKIAEQQLLPVREWASKGPGGDSPWLSVDASIDERLVCWGSQDGYAELASLDEAGQILHKSNRLLTSPASSQVIHHTQETAFILDLEGRLWPLAAKPEAPEVPLPASLRFSAGYRWR